MIDRNKSPLTISQFREK